MKGRSDAATGRETAILHGGAILTVKTKVGKKIAVGGPGLGHIQEPTLVLGSKKAVGRRAVSAGAELPAKGRGGEYNVGEGRRGGGALGKPKKKNVLPNSVRRADHSVWR